MTTAQPYTVVADQAKTAVDRSTQLWQRSTKSLADQTEAVSRLPHIDLGRATKLYFEYLHNGLTVNQEFTQKWADSVTSLAETTRVQWQALGQVVRGHGDAISQWLSGEAATVQQVVHEQADTARKVERAQARDRRQQARDLYTGLSKAELAEELGDRGLPKSGTVDELIDRLVEADTK